MLQHSPTPIVTFFGATQYNGVQTQTDITYVTTAAINPGEMIIWYWATNTVVNTVNISHTGLSSTANTASIQPTGATCMQGFLQVRYLSTLPSGSVITFNKPTLWGTQAVIGGYRVVNAQRVQNYGFTTVSPLAATPFGINMTSTSGTIIFGGYHKAQGTLALTVASSSTALTGVGGNYTALLTNSQSGLSVSSQSRGWAITPPGNELIQWQFASAATNMGVLILRFCN